MTEDIEPDVLTEIKSLRQELERVKAENLDLRRKMNLALPLALESLPETPALLFSPVPLPPLTTNSPKEKIDLFRILFKGREDVYPALWVNTQTGKKGYSPVCEDPWAGRQGKPKKYLPLTDQAIYDHLAGNTTIGVYPLLQDNTCWFLACDFDSDGWLLDALAYVGAGRRHGVPVYLERSRSGNGGHAWIFFSQTISAVSARQLGMRLLRDATEARGELDLVSYDRFFPNQDFMPQGGFGNLIALPLQKKCRDQGNSEFLNIDQPELKPFPDQWDFLSVIKRLTNDQVDVLLKNIPTVSVGPGASRRVSEIVKRKQPAPAIANCVLGAMISIEKSNLPPWLLSQIKHLSSLHNPTFYERQKMRFSTFGIPPLIRCYLEDMSHLHLPRGLLEEVETLFKEAGSQLQKEERSPKLGKLKLKFIGTLSSEQQKAMSAILSHKMGVLVAPPGAGKTVMGCFAIARRNVPALVLAHRKPILDQWRKQLTWLLGLKPRQIGQVGGGRRRQTGVVDLGMIQSLGRMDNLGDFFSRYGMIVVDECHHLPAVSFEACFRQANVPYVLGLTATPYRRDGLQEIITMQCGPIRHEILENRADLDKRLIIRETSLLFPTMDLLPIQEVFRTLVKNDERNRLILADVIQSAGQGRRCLILSQWKEHCRWFEAALKEKGKSVFVLSGDVGKKERTSILETIQEYPPDKELVVIATGQYLGEGFDCPGMDTLFLAFPVSYKGKLIQFVGRILRDSPGKGSAWVFDFADTKVHILQRMFSKRLRTYKSLGFAETAEKILGST